MSNTQIPEPEPPVVPSQVHPRARWLAALLCVAAAAFIGVVLTLPAPGEGRGRPTETEAVIAPPVVPPAVVTPPAAPTVQPDPPAPEVQVPPTAPPHAAPASGVIDVSALPRNASVRIDRHPVRRRTSVTPGKHIILASVDGYLPVADTVAVRSGDTVRWAPKLVVQPPAARPVASARPAAVDDAACRHAFNASNWSDASQSCRTAARAGSAFARRSMALLFQNGSGVARSDDSAAVWFQQGAAAGDAESMHELGQAYARGRGVRKDQAQAVQWYTRAATAGFASSQFVLGDGFEKGHLGLEKNRNQAVDWYRKAAAQGNVDAADRLKKLGQQ